MGEKVGMLQLSQRKKKLHKRPPLTVNSIEMHVEVDVGPTPLPARSGTSYRTHQDFKLETMKVKGLKQEIGRGCSII